MKIKRETGSRRGGVKNKRDISKVRRRERVREGYGIVGRRGEHIGNRGRSSLGGGRYGIYHSGHSTDRWDRDRFIGL